MKVTPLGENAQRRGGVCRRLPRLFKALAAWGVHSFHVTDSLRAAEPPNTLNMTRSEETQRYRLHFCSCRPDTPFRGRQYKSHMRRVLPENGQGHKLIALFKCCLCGASGHVLPLNAKQAELSEFYEQHKACPTHRVNSPTAKAVFQALFERRYRQKIEGERIKELEEEEAVVRKVEEEMKDWVLKKSKTTERTEDEEEEEEEEEMTVEERRAAEDELKKATDAILTEGMAWPEMEIILEDDEGEEDVRKRTEEEDNNDLWSLMLGELTRKESEMQCDEDRRKVTEEEARRKATEDEEESRRKAVEEEEAKRKAVEEEEARRKAAEEKARRKAAEEVEDDDFREDGVWEMATTAAANRRMKDQLMRQKKWNEVLVKKLEVMEKKVEMLQAAEMVWMAKEREMKRDEEVVDSARKVCEVKTLEVERRERGVKAADERVQMTKKEVVRRENKVEEREVKCMKKEEENERKEIEVLEREEKMEWMKKTMENEMEEKVQKLAEKEERLKEKQKKVDDRDRMLAEVGKRLLKEKAELTTMKMQLKEERQKIEDEKVQGRKRIEEEKAREEMKRIEDEEQNVRERKRIEEAMAREGLEEKPERKALFHIPIEGGSIIGNPSLIRDVDKAQNIRCFRYPNVTCGHLNMRYFGELGDLTWTNVESESLPLKRSNEEGGESEEKRARR